MKTPTFLLGGELCVNRVGFGAMRLCAQPGNFGPFPDWEAGKRLIRRAVELGVNFIDTAHAYGPGWNETLIGEALEGFARQVVVATKGGVEKTAPDRVFPDGRVQPPNVLAKARCLCRLGFGWRCVSNRLEQWCFERFHEHPITNGKAQGPKRT